MLIISCYGCSGGRGEPISPDTGGIPSPDGVENAQKTESSHQMLGLWQFKADPERQTLEVVRLRSADWHLNVLPFLEPPPLVNLTLESLDFPDYYTVDADIGLVHPFTDEDIFTGFDVCGIVFTVGTDNKYWPEIFMPGTGDTQLTNADGYSRWWNPVEFPHSPVFGYSDGLLGTPYSLSTKYNCTINAYKYYCDALGPNDDLSTLTPASRGIFSAGKKNIRNYVIKLGARGLTFNYGIDASWEAPAGSEPYDVPGDFPPAANRSEPYRIEVTIVSNTLSYDDYPSATGSGSAQLSVDVYDWFNASADRLTYYLPYGTPTFGLAPTSSTSDYATFDFTIDGTDLNMSGELEILFNCLSDEYHYSNFLPGERVCSYFKYILDVTDPTPDDGWSANWPSNVAYSEPDTAIDNVGNVFVTGYFTGTVDFNPGPGVDTHTSNSPAEFDAYLLKFSPDGIYLWGRTWGGSGSDTCNGVASDSLGSAYVGGAFWGQVDFDPGSGTYNLTSSSTPNPPYYSPDAFLSKIDASGNFVWAVAWGGGFSGKTLDTVYDVATDTSNSVYVTGLFSNDIVDFDPSTYIDNHTSTGGYDAYLSKFNSNGVYQGALTWGGLSGDDVGRGVAVDDTGNVYVTGYFEGLANFEPTFGQEFHQSNGAIDVFLSKFDAVGLRQWTRTWGGGGNERSYSVAVDNNGDVYTTGLFLSPTDFDPTSGTDTHNPSGGDAFLSKLDTNGLFLWARTWGGAQNDYAYDVAVDEVGNVYVAGDFEGTCNFDPGSGTKNHISQGIHDAVLTKFDPYGSHIWARTWGGTGDDYGQSVSVDYSGAVFFTGFYRYVVDFDPGPGFDLQGAYDVQGNREFLMKIQPDGYW